MCMCEGESESVQQEFSFLLRQLLNWTCDIKNNFITTFTSLVQLLRGRQTERKLETNNIKQSSINAPLRIDVYHSLCIVTLELFICSKNFVNSGKSMNGFKMACHCYSFSFIGIFWIFHLFFYLYDISHLLMLL